MSVRAKKRKIVEDVDDDSTSNRDDGGKRKTRASKAQGRQKRKQDMEDKDKNPAAKKSKKTKAQDSKETKSIKGKNNAADENYDYEVISVRKRNVILFQKYTFNKTGSKNMRYCSQKRNGCSARIQLDSEGKIIKAFKDHYHTPPHLTKENDGTYSLSTHIWVRRDDWRYY